MPRACATADDKICYYARPKIPINVRQSLAMLENIKIVLVNTSHTGNIGSAARAMKTMGLSQLILVDPVSPPDGKSRGMF